MASSITDPRNFVQHLNEKMVDDFLRIQTPPIPFDPIGDTPTKKKRVSENVVAC